MSSTAAANRRLEGKVAIVTASTEGWVYTVKCWQLSFMGCIFRQLEFSNASSLHVSNSDLERGKDVKAIEGSIVQQIKRVALSLLWVLLFLPLYNILHLTINFSCPNPALNPHPNPKYTKRAVKTFQNTEKDKKN